MTISNTMLRCPFWPNGEHLMEIIDEYDGSVDMSDYGSDIHFQEECVCGFIYPSQKEWERTKYGKRK